MTMTAKLNSQFSLIGIQHMEWEVATFNLLLLGYLLGYSESDGLASSSEALVLVTQ